MTDIIINYLWLLPLALAAVCNAVMDVCKDHWIDSIFNNSNRFDMYFWNTTFSWRNKYIGKNPSLGRTNIPVWFTDSWHLFKSLMIVIHAIALMLAAMYYQPIYTYFEAIVLYGLVWNGTFNLFYNKILKR